VINNAGIGTRALDPRISWLMCAFLSNQQQVLEFNTLSCEF
jgi:hypothetical protein